MRITLRVIFLLYLFAGNFKAQFTIENAFPNLTFSNAVFLCNAGDGSNRIFVVEQSGIIKVFDNSSTVQTQQIFLNIEDRVDPGGEMGLLGLAFHPDYENNGYFYVNYTKNNPRMTRISRFNVSDENPDSADKNSELIMLTFSQPYSNHNGGWIGFGPNDGYLYIATGDGGSGGDPQNNGQSITTFLGKILRIDVDNTDPGLEYAIPPDNPFIDSTGAVVKEIYAWGLRNPWRDSFDPVTGWLWTGDVGQNAYEEIDVIEKGKNYGWRCYEGNHNYNLSGCNYPEYTFPVWEYSQGPHCSVTGGYVYRGLNVPELTGKYIYSDYCSGVIWALEYDGTTTNNQTLLDAQTSVVSFGVDECNELYIVTFNPDYIYRFTPTVPIVAPTGLNGMAGISLGIPPHVIVDLWWNDNSENEDGFIIERKTNNGQYEVIDSVTTNITAYTDWNVIDTTTYTYRVAAYNSSNTSSYTCIEFTVTTLLRTLSAPTQLIATATAPDEVIVTWTDNEIQEEGYKIERKTGMTGNYELLETLATSTQMYTDQTVEENTIYYYRVYAFLEQIISEYSNEDSANTPSATVIDDLNTPIEYRLKQNYPNPFNPATKISYSVTEASNVIIKIYNSLGKEITIISNGIISSGNYELEWNAKSYASGIYYLKMIAESVNTNKIYTNVIKMIYLK